MNRFAEKRCGEAAGLAVSSVVAHIDADSFFASVIIRSNPHLRGKPLLALGMGGGCVIAATYEAKAKGIKTGMPLFEARKLCPGVIEMSADFRETGIASQQIESILKDTCPIVEQMSIDEWYLDLTSLVGGAPKNAEFWGKELQQRILHHTDLSVSIGIAPSKLLAKMAGEYRKPAGVTVVIQDCGEGRLHLPGATPLREKGVHEGKTVGLSLMLKDRPAAAIPGIGRQRQAKTDALGWKTAWDIATAPMDALQSICGRPGLDMQRELLGEQVSKVTESISPPKSISRCRTFAASKETEMAKAHLLKHLEYCVLKMRRWNLGCTQVSVWVRTPDFSFRGSHRKLKTVTTTAEDIAGSALSALMSLIWHGQRFNQVGLALSGLQNSDARQQSLFDDPEKVKTSEKLQEAMDALHTKFGRDSVTRAAALPVSSGTEKKLDFSIME